MLNQKTLNPRNLVMAALVSGLAAGASLGKQAHAESTESGKAQAQPTASKDGCKGHDSCQGKEADPAQAKKKKKTAATAGAKDSCKTKHACSGHNACSGKNGCDGKDDDTKAAQ